MAFKTYPVINTGDTVKDYTVKVNGVEVGLDTARVSAISFNRRWPGHQREIEQSELINFLRIETDGELEFEIMPKDAFEEVIIRPQTLGIKPTVENGVIRFTLKKAEYFTVEPFGRNRALHIFADNMQDYDIDINDENVLYFGAGEHEAGFITLHSNQTLFIDEGAVVYGLVRAKDAKNIKILGRGILDNSHNKEQILFECNESNNTSAVNNAKREFTVELEYCENVFIDGITIRDSLVYNIRPIACRNIHISNVKIIGCWRFNSDGIDMHNCENVLIERCFIRTFDDSICVKGFDCYYEGDIAEMVKKATYHNGEAYENFNNVRVRNCVIWNDWGRCLEIGAETKAEEIFDVAFEDCNIIHVTHNVLDCYNIDYADVHDITWRNITVEYDDVIGCPIIQKNDSQEYVNDDIDYCPPLMSAITTYHHEYSAGSSRMGKTRNLTFENINLLGRHKPKVYFEGYDEEHQTQDIIIKNVYHNGVLLEKFEDENFILKPFTKNIKYIKD